VICIALREGRNAFKIFVGKSEEKETQWETKA
jgi:putative heme iron utilization protein